MYTVLKRLNAVGTFALTVSMTLTALLAATSFFIPTDASSKIKVNGIQIQRVQDYFTRELIEMAEVTFDLDADISGLFNWNTRRVYLSLVASYRTDKMDVNQIVIWDTIQNHTDNHHIVINKSRPKYPLVDANFGLRGNNITFTLHWNIVPNAGLLTYGQAGSTSLRLPS